MSRTVEILGSGAFTYDEVSKVAARHLVKYAAKVRKSTANAAKNLFEAGAALIQAKAIVGHGRFQPWLEMEFGWSIRTAQGLMLIAKEFEGKYAEVSHLPQQTLLAIASRSTSSECKAAVYKLLKEKTVTASEIQNFLKKDRQKTIKERTSSATVIGRKPIAQSSSSQAITKLINDASNELIESSQDVELSVDFKETMSSGTSRHQLLFSAARLIERRVLRTEILGLARDLRLCGYIDLADELDKAMSKSAEERLRVNKKTWPADALPSNLVHSTHV